MSSRAYIAVTITLLLLLQYSNALNVLAIVSVPIRSHYLALQNLFQELALRGHNVTVINNYPDKEPPPGLEYIDLKDADKALPARPLESYENLRWRSLHHLYNDYRYFVVSSDTTTLDCERLLTNEDLKKHLSRPVKYDVVFVEQFYSDCGLAYAAMHFDAPIIGITTDGLLPIHYPRLGIPFDITKNAHYLSDAGTKPTLIDKVETALTDFLILTLNKWILQRKVNQIFAKYVPNYYVDLEKISDERMKMIFAYQHHSITGGRLLAPQLLEIGGIHIKKCKPLPKDLKEYLTSAEHGVIYMSFGSNLKAKTMSKGMRHQFMEAFRRLPQKVIWKWDHDSLPEESNDVLIRSWLPQLDILCHPKTLALITHGGMLSMAEAAHCGKPLLTVPFVGDQFGNAASARESGLGMTLYSREITADKLVEAIKELTSEKMQESARKVSRLWHDRPQPVMDIAIYWTEYVARHNSTCALPTKQTTWFQPTMIDVACVIFGIIITLILLMYVMLKSITKLIRQLAVKVLNSKDKTE